MAAKAMKRNPAGMLVTRPGNWFKTRAGGFSLVEIIVVVALMGLLLSIALPHYQRYLARGYRVEAIRMLTMAAACQERHRARTGAYDTMRCTGSSANEHYRLSIKPEAKGLSNGFTLIAEPTRRQTIDICGSLSLDQAGTRTISGPERYLSNCWSGH